ncbi:MAG: hypothetical protein RIS34_1722 [Pseudomonadota bacterium]|jgi:hypothetical protein
MDKQAIFRKSVKGAEAIPIRQAGFSPKLRSVLIMVDGKRRFHELAPLISMLGDPHVLMTELETTGLIELVGGTPDAPVASGAKLADPAPIVSPSIVAAPATLAGARRFASRLLTGLLGPMSETLCVKIEAARDLVEFIAAVKRARDVVREVKGQTAAAQFISQIEANTPSA